MKTLLTLALALAVSAGAMAADDKKPARKKGAPPVAAAVQLPKEVELTAEQKEKLAAVNKEFESKFADATKERDSILTDEQKKAQQAAVKDAREKMLKGKDAKSAIDSALKLTDEQKGKYEKASAKVLEVRTEAMKKFAESLTAEQKAKIPALAEKKPGKKKKDAK